MKTPEQASLERIEKAMILLVKAVQDLNRTLESQNRVLKMAFPLYKDVEEVRPEKSTEGNVG